MLRLREDKQRFEDLDFEEVGEVLTFLISTGKTPEVIFKKGEEVPWSLLFGSHDNTFEFVKSVRSVVTEWADDFVKECVLKAQDKLKSYH